MFSRLEQAPQLDFTIGDRARESVERKKAEERAAEEMKYNQEIENAARLFIRGVQRALKSSSAIETLMLHFKSIKISQGISMGVKYKPEDLIARIQEKLDTLPEYTVIRNVAVQHGWELAVTSKPYSVTDACVCEVPCGHISSSTTFNKIDLIIINQSAPAEMKTTVVS